MKVKFMFAVLPLMLATSSAFAVEGETSTINFTGNITESTCALSSGTDALTIPLGDVAANAFTGQGVSTTPQEFTIDLEDCSNDIATASVRFTGNTENDTTLSVTSGLQAAKNVGIQILQDGQALTVDGSAASTPVDVTPGENTLNFSARYISLDNTVVAGQANGTASFTMDYQ